MNVKRLVLKDFRNWESADVSLGEGINVFEGRNAQGKTNLLEALYLACVGKSMRTPRDKELIRHGCDRAYVGVEIAKRGGDERVEIALDKSQNKCVSINRIPLTRIGELMGVLLGVLFSPEEIKIVKDAPAERRRFMDVALSQMSKSYFYLLNRYNRILSQRNKLLKSPKVDENAIDVWDMQLARAGAGITKSRRGFIGKLFPLFKEAHLTMTAGEEEGSLSYEGAEGETAEEIEKNILRQLLLSRESDIKTGFTHCGAHKDDISISGDGMDLRTYGSQGQKRTAALSLQFSLLKLMTLFTGEKPILLLDDVMSELDVVRRARLMTLVRPYQTIITCTEFDAEAFDGDIKRFKISGGKFVE